MGKGFLCLLLSLLSASVIDLIILLLIIIIIIIIHTFLFSCKIIVQ